jgi:hypothetical protein
MLVRIDHVASGLCEFYEYCHGRGCSLARKCISITTYDGARSKNAAANPVRLGCRDTIL